MKTILLSIAILLAANVSSHQLSAQSTIRTIDQSSVPRHWNFELSLDGKFVATSSESSDIIYLFNSEKGVLVSEIEVSSWEDEDELQFGFSPQGQFMVAATYDGYSKVVKVFECATGVLVKEFDVVTDVSNITALSINDNGRVAVGTYGSILIYEYMALKKKVKPAQTIEIPRLGHVYDVKFLATGSQIAIASLGRAYVYDLASGAVTFTHEYESKGKKRAYEKIYFGDGGKSLVLSAGKSKSAKVDDNKKIKSYGITVIDLVSKKETNLYGVWEVPVSGFASTEDMYLISSYAGNVWLFDRSTGKAVTFVEDLRGAYMAGVPGSHDAILVQEGADHMTIREWSNWASLEPGVYMVDGDQVTKSTKTMSEKIQELKSSRAQSLQLQKEILAAEAAEANREAEEQKYANYETAVLKDGIKVLYRLLSYSPRSGVSRAKIEIVIKNESDEAKNGSFWFQYTDGNIAEEKPISFCMSEGKTNDTLIMSEDVGPATQVGIDRMEINKGCDGTLKRFD